MPDITPEYIDDGISCPRPATSSGAESKGRDLEYLFIDLNRVRQPGEIQPPSNFPSLSRKSIVRVVPKSNIVHTNSRSPDFNRCAL